MNDISEREFAAEMSRKLVALERNTHALNHIWGATAHRFRANPAIPKQDLADLENEFGVALPSDYRSYLVRVGDGGAGPWQGLLPIRDAIAESVRDCPECLNRPFPHGIPRLDADGVKRTWFQFRDPNGRGYVPVPLETAMSPNFMAGSLIIARGKPDRRAPTLYRLVLNGPERGRVWRDQRERSGGVGPCESASWRIHDPTFRDWMLAWMEQCEIGHQFGL